MNKNLQNLPNLLEIMILTADIELRISWHRVRVSSEQRLISTVERRERNRFLFTDLAQEITRWQRATDRYCLLQTSHWQNKDWRTFILTFLFSIIPKTSMMNGKILRIVWKITASMMIMLENILAQNFKCKCNF